MRTMSGTRSFDFAAFIAEVDRERQAQHLGWYELAGVLWNQSAELNARIGDHPI